MATSEGLTNVDPWSHNVDDSSWLLLPDTFSHDTDLLVRALHTTLTSPHYTLNPSFDSPVASHSKRKRDCLLPKSPTKRRRSRASKKSQTTFIAADPSNFRQMVQQVTGANNIHDSSIPILKTEPLMLVNKLPCAPADRSTTVPMLDTSAFLTNHHQQNLALMTNAFSDNDASNTAVDTSGSAAEFDTNSTFPTLESWKIM